MFLGLKIHKAINIIVFITHFPDEESCEIYLKGHRESSGIYYKTCTGFSKQYWFSASKFFSAVNAEEGLRSKPGL